LADMSISVTVPVVDVGHVHGRFTATAAGLASPRMVGGVVSASVDHRHSEVVGIEHPGPLERHFVGECATHKEGFSSFLFLEV
jgi:hypothetical protein